MIIQVRTSCDLIATLRIGLSPAWRVSKASLRNRGTTRVHVVNWDGSLRIEGDYSEDHSIENHPDHPSGRTTIGFTNGRIVLCRVPFPTPRSVVTYHELAYEEATCDEPVYEPLDGQWPRPAHPPAAELYEEE